ncbi:MAG: tRNA-specific adenosine deaminase [Phycisphaerae bacterium]|nr:tRNA-specific adenosine deaminase [Phycisphaerae bacterium]|tara:strand:- start:228 stop:707 length:480 start_codon:yes stop_codon:yes gene_type:complete
MRSHEDFMRRAIELAHETALVEHAGGPFGCVIVKDGEMIAEGANRVIADGDPTSHGEMNAIRSACQKLGTHDLTGCTLYTSGEPCPMCFAACCWAHIDEIFYASTCADASEYGQFDDSKIATSLKQSVTKRDLPAKELLRDEMLEIWNEFKHSSERAQY